MPDFGERLKEERIQRNLTQSAMAEMLGIKRSTYSLYESGKREPNIEILQQIATILCVTLDELVGWDKNKSIISNLENSPVAAHITGNAMKKGLKQGIAQKANKEYDDLSYDDIAAFMANYAKELTQEEKLNIIKILSEIK